MRRNYLYIFGLSAALFVITVESSAQTADAGPMAYATSVHAAKIKTKTAPQVLFQASDYFKYNYGADSHIVAQIAAELTRKYGLPKTGRGDLKVWEVRDTTLRENVTIMIGSNRNSEYELIIDQRSPNRQTLTSRSKPAIMPNAPRRNRALTRLSQERD